MMILYNFVINDFIVLRDLIIHKEYSMYTSYVYISSCYDNKCQNYGHLGTCVSLYLFSFTSIILALINKYGQRCTTGSS